LRSARHARLDDEKRRAARPEKTHEHDAIDRRMRSKLKIVLLIALLFGAPALVTAALLATDFGSAVTDTSQPGGTLRGTLVDPDGRAVGGLEVALVAVSASGTRNEGERASSASDGAFALHAEPVDGHYEILTGGGEWQKTIKPYSFVDADAKHVEAQPARIVLERGCRLELEFERAGGDAACEGEYTLRGEYGRGLFFGLVKPQMKLGGAIKDGRLSLSGLPPMKADIFVKMASGETVELTLDLKLGMNKKSIRI
jgi:hypothetical protein